MTSEIITRLLLLATILTPGVAAGKPTIVKQAVNVSYDDLDLTSKVDQQTLRRRLTAAIARACAPDDRADPEQLADRSCFTRSMKAGRTKIDDAIAQANSQRDLALAASADQR